MTKRIGLITVLLLVIFTVNAFALGELSLRYLKKAEKAMDKGDELLSQGKKEEAFKEYEEAINYYDKVLNEDYTFINAFVNIVQLYMRMEKLQEGYDWNITRTFCLRIIRCIDNLDNRISRALERGDQTVQLEEIRDELLFALESSCVEQFEPEINSEYSGNEKLAEVVKERQACNDTKTKGKIAKVIKPGYLYVIDDETTKVVRPARVMLFE